MNYKDRRLETQSAINVWIDSEGDDKDDVDLARVLLRTGIDLVFDMAKSLNTIAKNSDPSSKRKIEVID